MARVAPCAAVSARVGSSDVPGPSGFAYGSDMALSAMVGREGRVWEAAEGRGNDDVIKLYHYLNKG